MINLHRIWFTKIHTGILTIITRDTICTEIQVLIISLKDLLNLNSFGFERSTLLEQRLKVKLTDMTKQRSYKQPTRLRIENDSGRFANPRVVGSEPDKQFRGPLSVL